MPITTSNFSAMLWPGIESIHSDAVKAYDPQWVKLVDVSTSTMNTEETYGLSGLGQFQVKDEGDSIVYDTMRQGFRERYQHIVYSLGFVITREMYDDNQYAQPMQYMTNQLAWVGQQTKETIVHNMYNNAFDSTAKTFGDGKELCATDHPNITGGTWANEPTTASDLSEASLENDVISIQALLDDRGNKLAISPVSLHIHPNDQFEAKRILGSPYRVGVADNDLNALKATEAFPGGFHVHHFFTDSDAYFIRTNLPSNSGPRYFERDPDEFAPMKDNDFDTDNAKYKARMRFSVGCDNKRSIWGNPGA